VPPCRQHSILTAAVSQVGGRGTEERWNGGTMERRKGEKGGRVRGREQFSFRSVVWPLGRQVEELLFLASHGAVPIFGVWDESTWVLSRPTQMSLITAPARLKQQSIGASFRYGAACPLQGLVFAWLDCGCAVVRMR